MAEFEFEKGWFGKDKLKDKKGRLVGTIATGFKYQIEDSNGRLVAKAGNSEIENNCGRVIAKIYNDQIQDNNGRVIAKISDIRREIEGADYLDPSIVAALWICFITSYVFRPYPECLLY